MKKLKALRARGPGEDPDLESLPLLPDLPTGEGTVAIFIPSAKASPKDGTDELSDEELVKDEPLED